MIDPSIVTPLAHPDEEPERTTAPEDEPAATAAADTVQDETRAPEPTPTAKDETPTPEPAPVAKDETPVSEPAAKDETPASEPTPEVKVEAPAPAPEVKVEPPAPAPGPKTKPTSRKEPAGADSAKRPGGKAKEPPAPAEAKEPETPPKDDKKRWYVVKVQSGREESIKEAIERRVKIEGLEEFFDQVLIPMDKETLVKDGKRVVRERKRYPGYIMAKVEFNDQILYLFRETSGVGDFVGGALNQPPLPMSDREVTQMLGAQHKEGPGPEKPPPSPFILGDRVKVRDGVFSGMEGDVKEVLENKGQVRIELMVLGRPVAIELEYWQVEQV